MRFFRAAYLSMSGGQRKGAGRKKKYAVAQSYRTVSLKLSTSLYEQWSDLKVRMKFKMNDDTAEYLLNLTQTFDEQPLPRYGGAFLHR